MKSALANDALVLVDKPAGVTSFDVVRRVSRAVGTRRVGHAGTLDPFATGLLVILSGRATRLIRFVPGEPKVYDATIAFGTATDTDDLTGETVRTAPLPTAEQVVAGIATLTGTIEQMPPAYSAKKIGGQRAYAIARRGATPALAAATVRVFGWEVMEHSSTHLRARISCAGGTYIRALARDLGAHAGSAAHLAALRRIRSGPFDVETADAWADVEQGRVRSRPALDALVNWEHVLLSTEDVARIRRGMVVAAVGTSTQAALVDDVGALVAVAERRGDNWQPTVVIPDVQ